jgi:uncharacterized protein (DUF1501 family)
MDQVAFSRRDVLRGGGALFAWAGIPKLARAEGRDPRLLVCVLRGGLDGLAAVAPVGDPNWLALRGDRALTLSGERPALPLDGFFALNPAMPNLHRLYRAEQAIIVHAVNTPYVHRSHFDGQDVLESGFPKPGHTDTGWLNRALVDLQSAGRVNADSRALGIGPVAPLVVRGAAPMLIWQSERIPPAATGTAERLMQLYRHVDPIIGAAFEGGLRIDRLAREEGAPPREAGAGAQRIQFVEAAGAAARLMARADGPRVGAIAFNGWDTHFNAGIAKGPLADLLAALDTTFAALERGLGAAWSETIVAVVTEFGRTARMNGAAGTDHGTGTVAFLLGGAVKGGRVISDWPGLRDIDLFEKRDLRATTDLRAVLKGILADHLRIERNQLDHDVFPGSAAVAPTPGLTHSA